MSLSDCGKAHERTPAAAVAERGRSPGMLLLPGNMEGTAYCSELCQQRRTDRRLLLLLYVQWCAAVALAAWHIPNSAMAAASTHTSLLLVFLIAGIATMLSSLAVGIWRGQRPSRLIIALSQGVFSSLLVRLAGPHTGIHLHLYASLALLSMYDDWLLPAVASLVAMADRLISAGDHLHACIVLPHAGKYLFRDALLIAATNAFLLWWARLRRREAEHTERLQQHQQRLLYQAFHDPVTGLPNRAAIEFHMDAWMERRTASLTCLYLDVDGLRSVNDLLGHRGGDALMRSIVGRIRQCIVWDDLLARFSGDRFLVLVTRPHTRQQVEALADRIVESMLAPHITEGRALYNTVSIGVAAFPADGGDRETLLDAADRGVRAVKSAGRNSYRFACDLHEEDERTSMLGVKLQQALMEGSLHLVYQPIFAHGERMVAVEALARWHDAVDGPVSPAEFIPIAEATGLIVPLSDWVLREACLQMARWLAQKVDLDRMAINVSVKQVARADFPETVERTLLDTGLPAANLELELTEGALATDFDAVKRNLGSLRRLGVRISIDDFGTGYSSLSRVRELDADVLKIDRIFVQGAGDTANGAAMIQAIIDMAHTLGLHVIAEGVETPEQMQMLHRMGCDEVQGFLLARPQPPESITTLLHTRQERSPAPQLIPLNA